MAGTWDVLDNQPAFSPSTMLLLSDGRVICQQDDSTQWFAFAPDARGNYRHGTWSPIAASTYPRRYYASAVLRNGKVIVVGGEYAPNPNDDINAAEIYDPLSNSWRVVAPAPWSNAGDAPCCLLANGQLLVGHIFDTQAAIYDPVHDRWRLTGSKHDASSEETWTLLRDGSVLTVQCNNTLGSERYIPSSGTWVDAGSTPVDLVQHSSQEIGPAILLPDGRVFAIGATGHTALYTPASTPGGSGTWVAGPDFPAGGDGLPTIAKDAPAVLLPNGRVLCCAGLASTTWGQTTSFYEFDPETSTLNEIASPTGSGHDTYWTRMQLLPTGEVLCHGGGTVSIYNPDGRHREAWEPAIIEAPDEVVPGQSYRLTGHRFNGVSQANSYGDDCMNATNYPLVRLHYRDGRVIYAPTHGHSTMGVATGHTPVHTEMTVPTHAPHGEAQLCVVANGIPSDRVEVDVVRRDLDRPREERELVWERLAGSLADGPLWVIGADGRPHPVPAWAPEKLRKEVAGVREEMQRDLERLTRLGEEVLAAVSARAREERQQKPVQAPSSGRARQTARV